MSDATLPPRAMPPTGVAAAGAVRHSYPLQVRDYGLATAIGLVMQSLPYAVMRFAVQLAVTLAGILWLIIAIGGAAWLGTHIAQAFGWVWFLLWLVGVGWFWGAILRYALHLIECGHVAVLTELITRGAVGNGSESMFAYGRRIVTERFGEVNVLFGLNALVRGVLQAFHRTLDWIGEMIPIPGLESVASIINLVLRAATRYLDKVIFSYNLARNDGDPWRGAREGIIYYCQNAKPILKTSVGIVIQERVLTFILWIVLLTPAAAITVMLPQSVREWGGLVSVVIAIMLTGAVRSAFLKPIFLVKMMIRYHALVENQPINESWDARLAEISDKFRDLGRKGTAAVAAAAASV
jgi:hypothetical protein